MNELPAFALGFSVATLIAVTFIKPDKPRLVGYECVGSSGPLYAREEDHLPPCKRIEAFKGKFK